jgi:paired amphipathic helix protein Sin3a
MLKPISDFEVNLFKKSDNVTPSYYRVPEEFPMPMSTGRYKQEHVSKTLNDNYCSSTIGTENFKFKIRNANEENLFKNEDEMYEIDQGIIQFESCMRNIQKEQERLETLDREIPYKPKYLTARNIVVIKECY